MSKINLILSKRLPDKRQNVSKKRVASSHECVSFVEVPIRHGQKQNWHVAKEA